MLKNYFNITLALLIVLWGSSCGTSQNHSLKIYGERSLDENGDTIYFTIPEFEFTNQDKQKITLQNTKGKVFVTDFFFTTCPTICPRMKDQMLRVYEEFKGNPDVIIISHTIDTKHDTVELLYDFAYNKLEIKPGIWHFVTGEKNEIYEMARNYMIVASEDGTAPGGYVHSGKFILIDKKGQIRGYYDGTDPLSVSDLMHDMKALLAEKQ